MLKRKRIGLIVWGVILTVFGFFMLLGSGEILQNVYKGDLLQTSVWIIIVVSLLLGGTLMLVFGIVNAVKVSRYNNRILEANRDIIYITTCYNCGYQISAKFTDFTPHSRFPEGFVYCPVCKKPCGKNAFRAYKQDNGGTYGG